jgi:hypothetical protein
MNLDNFGGLAAHYWICCDHIESMEAGGRGKDGRAFSRGAMLYLRVIIDALARKQVDPGLDTANSELARLWGTMCVPGGGEVLSCDPTLQSDE